MASTPSINGIRSNSESYTNNEHSGLETERRVRTNNPAPSIPSPRGHA
jgi:hypothetical protein